MDDQPAQPWGDQDFWAWAEENPEALKAWKERYPDDWKKQYEQQPPEIDLEGSHTRGLEWLERDYAKTGNPLYVWRAIETCYRHHRDEWSESLPDGDVFGEAARNNPFSFALPSLPNWCMRYLVDVALRFRYLERGLDESQRPDERKFTDIETLYQAFDVWLRNPTLSPQDAARRIGNALGLTRPGWNAFNADLRGNEDVMMLEAYSDLRSRGQSSAEAIEQLRREYGLEEERSVWRRLAKARRALR